MFLVFHQGEVTLKRTLWCVVRCILKL
uniref:Uncharacterized protein n=1 Tax=Megaselia scalaris TaxID=36166 RepID=T1GK29_MEGSC